MTNYDKDIVQIHVNALQRIYSAFIDLEDKEFFLGIGNYIKYIDDNSEVFNPIIEKINNLEKADSEKYITLSAKVLEESKQTVETLIKLVKDSGVEDKKLDSEIEEYHHYLDGSTRSTQRLEMSIYFCAVDILRVLEFLGKKELVKDFLKLDKSGDVIEYKIAVSYGDYILAERDYKSKEKLGLWYVWSELVSIYRAEYHYESIIKELHEKNDSLNLMFFATYKDDIDKIISGSPPRILSKGKLLYGVRSIHNFFTTEMEKLSLLPQESQLVEEEPNAAPKEKPKEWLFERTPSGGALLKYKKEQILKFRDYSSDKCRYFRCIWDAFSNPQAYKTIYLYDVSAPSSLKYPDDGYSKINTGIRNHFYKMKGECRCGNKNSKINFIISDKKVGLALKS
jgi:hypothetical protein